RMMSDTASKSCRSFGQSKIVICELRTAWFVRPIRFAHCGEERPREPPQPGIVLFILAAEEPGSFPSGGSKAGRDRVRRLDGGEPERGRRFGAVRGSVSKQSWRREVVHENFMQCV